MARKTAPVPVRKIAPAPVEVDETTAEVDTSDVVENPEEVAQTEVEAEAIREDGAAETQMLDEQQAPARMSAYSVRVDEVPQIVLNAASPGDAIHRYNKHHGIIATTGQHTVHRIGPAVAEDDIAKAWKIINAR